MTSWATAAQVRERTPVAHGLSDGQVERATAAASDVLTGLSGVRPVEEVTVRHQPCPCSGQVFTGPYDGVSPFWWRAGPDLVTSQGGGCEHLLRLPDNPVVAVTAVRLGGVPLDPTWWELVDGNSLRRVSGSWTGGELVVTYTTGTVTELALRAVAALAGELLKAETGDKSCALPQRLQTVTRQGVTMAMLDPQTFLAEGRTGLYLVDLFLAASKAPRRTVAVTSPDVTRFDQVRG